MSSDEEIVPGDEDEQEMEDREESEEKTSGVRENTGRKRKSSKKKNQLRISTSAPEVSEYKLNAAIKKINRNRASSTIEGESEFTESDEGSGSSSQPLQFQMEDNYTEAPNTQENTKNTVLVTNTSRKVKKEGKTRSQASPMKISRGLRKTSTALLRKAGTITDLKEESKLRKKTAENSASAQAILSQFQLLLMENDSSVLRIILQSATKEDYSEGTQNSLLHAITELILRPDSGIPTTPHQFLSSFISSDIKLKDFRDWEEFTGKDNPENPQFLSITTHLPSINWWHVAQSYLIVIFTKSSFFREAFRIFVSKLEKNTASSRKKHKIFPLLFSFFSDLNKGSDKIPIIFIETIVMIKQILSEYIPEPLHPMGALFRIVTSAISSILYNPRKWNFEIAIDLSPFLRRTLQSIAIILEEAMLKPNHQCDNQIETSLVENIYCQLHELILFSSNENEALPRFMTWTDSQTYLNAIYTHLYHNFDKIWLYIIQNDPSVSLHFVSFSKISLQAINPLGGSPFNVNK